MARILVVDGHPFNRGLLASMLSYRGHVVLEAGDGAEAFHLALAECPDLVITDLLMPIMDGYELVTKLRASPALATTRVIFYTPEYLIDEVRPLAAATGVRHVVPKRAEPALLVAVINEALAEEMAPTATSAGELQREYLRALSAKLVDKVSQLEAAEGALRTSEARFRSLAESSPIGIFSLDASGTISYSNPRLRQICGLPDLDGMQPQVWAELLHVDDRSRVVAGITEMLAAETTYCDRIRVVRPDAEIRWVDLQASPVADDEHHFTHVGTVEDVSAIVAAEHKSRELEARLRSSERLESLGQLAAGIAHDFNNLLGATLNYAQCISSDIERLTAGGQKDPRLARMRKDAESIRSVSERAADLTHQLLAFGRQEIMRTEVIDLNDVVAQAEKLLGRTIGEHVSLVTSLDPDVWPVTGDGGRLGQVVMNLVINARDAIVDTGGVTITTANVELDEHSATRLPDAGAGRYSRISVSDNGVGMAPETAARAFEPFFTTKPMGKGTGLGLATVYGIVKQLGGFVGIDSRLGEGTTVHVDLPATDSTTANPRPAAHAPEVGHGEVVLVVEDDEDMRELTSRLLTESGYSVLLADRGGAAVAMLEDRSVVVDLLLTDVVMPEMSGREVAERAMKGRPGLPILLMSGYAEALFSPQPGTATDVEIIAKPFTHAALLRSVAGALGRQTATRRRRGR